MTKNTNVRLFSLDALRGFDMLFIMGGATIFRALPKLFPDSEFVKGIAEQMYHMEWDGFLAYDLIFPLFLFVAGISYPFSYAKQVSSGVSRKNIYKKILTRGLVLVLLGIFYNGFLKTLDFENARYLSVLGRIGLAWAGAALIFINTKVLTRILICVGTLIGYCLLVMFVPAPDAAGAPILSVEGNIVSYIDRVLAPGTIKWGKVSGMHDSSGLLSTIPAIITALMGMLTGEWIRFQKKGLTETRKSIYLFAAGAALIGIGLLWGTFFPINKNLWNSSFTCYVGGISACMFALFYYVVDVLGYRKWTFFFRVIGLNSITIYLAQRLINFKQASQFLFGGIIDLFPANAESFVAAICYTLTCWLFLYFLYKRNIFLKV